MANNVKTFCWIFHHDDEKAISKEIHKCKVEGINITHGSSLGWNVLWSTASLGSPFSLLSAVKKLRSDHVGHPSSFHSMLRFPTVNCEEPLDRHSPKTFCLFYLRQGTEAPSVLPCQRLPKMRQSPSFCKSRFLCLLRCSSCLHNIMKKQPPVWRLLFV